MQIKKIFSFHTLEPGVLDGMLDDDFPIYIFGDKGFLGKKWLW